MRFKELNFMNPEELAIFKTAIHHHKQNNFQSAFDLYSQVLNSNPSNHQAKNLLGILLTQTGHIELGKKYISVYMNEIESVESPRKGNQVFRDSVAAKTNQEKKSIDLTQNYPIRDFDTVDAWRHLRMLDFVEAINQPDDIWLTVGDAYGHDAKILKAKGVTSVTASNLDAQFLAKGHQMGEVSEYLELNAENTGLPDSSYDYVLCKEALHHMPRPYLAIYEMLRISRKGICFIEPQDSYIDWPAKKNEYYRELVKDELVGEKISFKKTNTEEIISSAIDWWEDGPNNYVYTLSKREIRKISLGLGIPNFALKCFNDYYEKEISSELIIENGPGFRKTKEQIQLHDQLCALIGKSSAYITGLLFKQTPTENERSKLANMNYDFTFTPTRYLPIEWPKI